MPQAQPLRRLVEILRRFGGASYFGRCLERPKPIDISDFGTLRFPIGDRQAKKLHAAGRPAHYGQGTETLLDASVRDTSEISADRVSVDEEWQERLDSVVETMAATLGLPPSCKLRAELHSLLIYGPGQFFLPHKDSEKADGMVATLVATLPSFFVGGELIVEHQGERQVFKGDSEKVEFVAFYADCLHAVEPVSEGHRVSLTYNLVLEPDSVSEAESTTVEAALAEALDAYFTTPPPVSRWWREEKGASPDPPPDRFVFLLDHEYTEAGLSLGRLKGNDRARVQGLQAAADALDCKTALAQVTVRENWHCTVAYDPYYRYSRSRHRSWSRGEDGWEESADTRDSPDDYELVDLIDSEAALTRRRIGDGKLETVDIPLASDTIGLLTPTSELEPYASEYEGYTGNAGSTMDRWYRRAAFVVWPRAFDLVMALEADPKACLSELADRARNGEILDELLKRLPDPWQEVMERSETLPSVTDVLALCNGVEDPELGTTLLRPLRLEILKPNDAEAWADLHSRWGQDALWQLLVDWSEKRSYFGASRHLPSSLEWIESMDNLCAALVELDHGSAEAAARLLINDRWIFWSGLLDDLLKREHPETRSRGLDELSQPLIALFKACLRVDDDALQDEILSTLDGGIEVLPLLLNVLRKAAQKHSSLLPALAPVQAIAVELLQEHLSQPARDPDDWTVSIPNSCKCALCAELTTFLEAPDRKILEWPIAKAKRQHIHQVLDQYGAPVRHQTRRSGSPYVLVLTKEDALHRQEIRQRKQWTKDLKLLNGLMIPDESTAGAP